MSQRTVDTIKFESVSPVFHVSMLGGCSLASIPIAPGVWSHPPARLSSLYLRRSSLTEDPARPACDNVPLSATSRWPTEWR
jgi:hypothetical protein